MSFLNKLLGLEAGELPGVEVVLQLAAASADAGISKKTFRQLNQFKANGATSQGIDFYRAHYFLNRKQTAAAIQALKEELRYHPGHPEARALLESLQPGQPASGSADDSDDLLRVARDYTMVGEARLRSLYQHAKTLCEQDIPGHFVECGVAAGGTSALLAGVINRHSQRDRLLFAFDTFEGMPEPGKWDSHDGQPANESGWGQGTCAAPETSLMKAAAELDATEYVRPVKGLFADTLPAHRDEVGAIALLHVDGDWYQSTLDILENFYEMVSPGGIIQIDDYGYWEGCRKAVKEFEQKRGFQLDLIPIDGTGVWLEKSA
jgi:hypothetical protein